MFMILGNITATCLTYFDCMVHKNDAWGVDNARFNSHLYQDLKYTIRTSKKKHVQNQLILTMSQAWPLLPQQ